MGSSSTLNPKPLNPKPFTALLCFFGKKGFADLENFGQHAFEIQARQLHILTGVPEYPFLMLHCLLDRRTGAPLAHSKIDVLRHAALLSISLSLSIYLSIYI